MTKLSTSDTRDFTPKQIEILRAHHAGLTEGEVIFLEEMHWWSSKLNYWTEDQTAALFWQENIPVKIPGATNWFGYYWRRERDPETLKVIGQPNLLIFGMPKFEPVIDAVYIPEIDTLTYSRYQHDFFTVPGTEISVDGGRAYMRVLFGKRESHAVVPYNLMTKTFEFKGKTHHVESDTV